MEARFYSASGVRRLGHPLSHNDARFPFRLSFPPKKTQKGCFPFCRYFQKQKQLLCDSCLGSSNALACSWRRLSQTPFARCFLPLVLIESLRCRVFFFSPHCSVVPCSFCCQTLFGRVLLSLHPRFLFPPFSGPRGPPRFTGHLALCIFESWGPILAHVGKGGKGGRWAKPRRNLLR